MAHTIKFERKRDPEGDQIAEAVPRLNNREVAQISELIRSAHEASNRAETFSGSDSLKLVPIYSLLRLMDALQAFEDDELQGMG